MVAITSPAHSTGFFLSSLFFFFGGDGSENGWMDGFAELAMLVLMIIKVQNSVFRESVD